MSEAGADPVSSGVELPTGQVAVWHATRGVAVVAMRGEHDLSTQRELSQALERAAAHSNVVVDLSECSFIDSAIVKEFVKCCRVVCDRGERFLLVVPAAQRQVARVAEMMGLSDVFELHQSRTSALDELAGPGS